MLYTSRGHSCGIYSELIFVESKALKQAHSRLRNCFSNAAIGKNQPLEIRNRDRAKYTLVDHQYCFDEFLNHEEHEGTISCNVGLRALRVRGEIKFILYPIS